MIDPTLLRSDPDSVALNLARRGFVLDVEALRHPSALPLTIAATDIETGASVGFACWPSDAENGEALIRAADVALHQAKQRARGRAIAFNATMEAERQIRHRIERRLRLALANHELMLHFQPVFEIKTGHLRGFEALVRLNDDAGRPIPPSAFIPVAEEVGLIGDVGAWVLREACRVAGQWPDDLFVAVNLSPAQFTPGGIARQVRDDQAYVAALLKELDIKLE